MKTILKLLFATLVLAIVAVAGLAAHSWTHKPLRFAWFLDRVAVERGLDDPELLTGLRVLEPWGIRGHNSKLTDESIAAGQRRYDQARAQLAMLQTYDRASLSPVEQQAFDVLRWSLVDTLEGEPFRYHDQPVNPVFGAQSELPSFMVTQHVIEDARDAHDYVERLNLFETKFDQLLEVMKLQQDRQILPQKFVAEKVLSQMKAFIAMPAAEHLLVTTFKSELAQIADLPDDERGRLLGLAVVAVETSVYPAYGRLIAWFEQLLPRLRGNDGAWALPQGAEFYAWAVKHHTSSDLTPDQVHEIGLQEVARIEAEMDAILKAQGYAEGTVGSRMTRLGTEPRFNYADTDEARAQILVDYQTFIDEMDVALGPWFNRRPKAKVVVQRVPVFKEKTSPGAYYDSPPLDGSRPGVFWINLRNVAEIQKFGMRTLAYHEAIPGHHFQIAIAQELRGVPLIQKLAHFTAYIEGWALYSERLAKETGLEKDPFDDLGRLQGELFRAVRLVVDTGMHQLRWSRERAIEYMIAHTGSPETDVVAEIERYLVWPGQALAYKIGMNEILRLREQARSELGERFDLREFHDLVLGAGAMPLGVLDARVQAWIAQQAEAR
ncbi:MAG: DUF885 domain-containing protein [Panacagrimonas sp.]